LLLLMTRTCMYCYETINASFDTVHCQIKHSGSSRRKVDSRCWILGRFTVCKRKTNSTYCVNIRLYYANSKSWITMKTSNHNVKNQPSKHTRELRKAHTKHASLLTSVSRLHHRRDPKRDTFRRAQKLDICLHLWSSRAKCEPGSNATRFRRWAKLAQQNPGSFLIGINRKTQGQTRMGVASYPASTITKLHSKVLHVVSYWQEVQLVSLSLPSLLLSAHCFSSLLIILLTWNEQKRKRDKRELTCLLPIVICMQWFLFHWLIPAIVIMYAVISFSLTHSWVQWLGVKIS
jgi:hypothetical protein